AVALGALMTAPALADDVKIGSVAGITGPIAELVAPIMDGRALAATHINEQGGLLGGDQMVMIAADSQCDPKAGVDAGNKVVNVDQVVAIVGASCSGATNGMVQSVTIPAGIPSVSDSATAPSISDLDDKGLVFRTAPSDAYQGAALAEYAFAQGMKSLAVTYANDDYNAGIASVFVSTFEGLGGTVTANQVHEPNKASYRAEVATMSGAGDADGLALFAYYGGSGITIIKNSLETGSFEKFVGADGMFDQSVIDQIGADTLRGNIWLTQSASDPDSVSFKNFAETYAATGNDPQAPYAAHGYDATFMVALAIEKAGSTDSAAIAAALMQINDPAGEVVNVGEWSKAKELIAAGKAINYAGATGSVDFDARGDVPGFYGVNTIGEDGTWETTLLR
ncbi:MAG: ABC transporter substrate-binding protein, partial [Pseudomonadota bacterium]